MGSPIDGETPNRYKEAAQILRKAAGVFDKLTKDLQNFSSIYGLPESYSSSTDIFYK